MSSLDSHDIFLLGSATEDAFETTPTSHFEEMNTTTDSTDFEPSESNETSNVSNPPVGQHSTYVWEGPRNSLLEKSQKSQTLCTISENLEIQFPKGSSFDLSTQHILNFSKPEPKKITAGRGTPKKTLNDLSGTLSQSLTGYDPIDSPLNRLAIERAMLLFTPGLITDSNQDQIFPSLKIRMEEDIARILELPKEDLNDEDLIRLIIDVFRYRAKELMERDRSEDAEDLLSLIQAAKLEYELS